jgi:hemerythrin superfamily protein
VATAKKAAKTATKKVAAKKAASRSGPDAIRLLTTDHREVHRLFEDYKDLVESEAEGTERQALAEQICAMLTAHTTIEEEIFYPAARQALEEEEDLLDEAEVEHASAKDLIAQIQSMGPDDDLYDAKVTVLGEYVDHHVEEEEGEMFPKCKKADLDMKALGEQLAARKQELLAQQEMGQ